MSGSNVYFQNKRASTQVYTSGSGNFVVPDGVFSLSVEMYGGGGSGATTRAVEAPGFIYSGEAGNAVTTTIHVTPGQSLAYSIGAGGVAPAGGLFSAPGIIGGTTTFGDLKAAGGAGAGFDRFNNISISYGVGVGRDGLRGSGGTSASASGVTVYGGDGGYGNGGTSTVLVSNLLGQNGGVGAGGSSSYSNGGTSIPGGNGGAGRIQIWWIA